MDYLEIADKNQLQKKILNALPESTRLAIGEQIFLTNLYPFYFLKELDQTINDIIDKPSDEIFKDIGKHFALNILDKYFFNYIESKNPVKFLAQIGNLYTHLWNFGKYTLDKSEDDILRISFEYDGDIYKEYCLFLREFLKTGIELCGGKEVEIDEKECQAEECSACRFEIKWN
jgi:uncharacterized protein (TIGR02265 family)